MANKDPHELFMRVLSIETPYECDPPENICTPFGDFFYKFSSLYRNWILSLEFQQDLFECLSKANDNEGECASYYDIFSETVGVDQKEIPEFLKMSTLTIGLSLVENLLSQLSIEIARKLNINIELDKRNSKRIRCYQRS